MNAAQVCHHTLKRGTSRWNPPTTGRRRWDLDIPHRVSYISWQVRWRVGGLRYLEYRNKIIVVYGAPEAATERVLVVCCRVRVMVVRCE